MFATITDNPSEIRQIFQPSTYSSSRLWELAQKANELALIVEESWEFKFRCLLKKPGA